MDFSLPKEYQLFRRMVREFTEREILPLAPIIDREHRVPFETLVKLGQLGLMGVPFPQKYGGMGGGELGYCILMEEVNRVCTSTATIIGAHTGIGAMAIYLDGTEEQKQKYLRPLAQGEKIAAFALTEPGAGSDAAAIKTTAVRSGGHYILNGTKTFITNGSMADVIIVLCQTDPNATPGYRGQSTLLVEKGAPGLEAVEITPKMGIHMTSTAELSFNGVRVPGDRLLGAENRGFYQVLNFFDESRIEIAAQALGIAQGAFDRALSYTTTREQFGEKISDFQVTRHKLADMATQIELARLITYEAALSADNGNSDGSLSAMAKLTAARTAMDVGAQAIQLLGGYGYMTEYEVERYYRDAKVIELLGGTQATQKDAIAGSVIGKI